MTKKIVHILYGGLGGHGQVVFTLLNRLPESQHIHLIFYGVESPLEEYLEKCREKSIEYTTVLKSEGEFIKPLYSIYRKLKTIQPDIVFAHSSNALLPSLLHALLSRAKIIFVEHHANHLKSRKEWFLSICAMLFAKKVVYLSDVYRKQVKKKLGKYYRDKKAKVIPNGIDLKLFSPSMEIQKTSSQIIFGMASRLAPTKDHLTLIRAFSEAKVKNTVLVIAGTGETQESLQHLVEDLSIRESVIFTGMLSQGELIRFFRNLDIYVHSSLGETMSMAIAQAQACGLPVIASDVKGINNVIQESENGILFRTRRQLCDAMIELSENEELRKHYANASRQYAIKYLSDETMSREYSKLIDL